MMMDFLIKECVMSIKYDNKRSDITFCTMLFKMPQQNDLNSLKHMQRKFEEFYLPSLKVLINTFKKVALWCDKETAEFIKNENLESEIAEIEGVLSASVSFMTLKLEIEFEDDKKEKKSEKPAKV